MRRITHLYPPPQSGLCGSGPYPLKTLFRVVLSAYSIPSIFNVLFSSVFLAHFVAMNDVFSGFLLVPAWLIYFFRAIDPQLGLSASTLYLLSYILCGFTLLVGLLFRVLFDVAGAHCTHVV
jgi:hypothetical protein